MTNYRGEVQDYQLFIESPNLSSPQRHIALWSSLGGIGIYFVPAGDPQLDQNHKEPNRFLVYHVQDAWPAIVELLRNERSLTFTFDEAQKVWALFSTNFQPVGNGKATKEPT